jgi:hypothetical protein
MADTALIDKGAEEEHGCCMRVLMFPMSVASFVPAAFFLIAEIIAAPILFIVLVCCKIGICTFCCPKGVHNCFRNVICTPFRWMRISCTGKGEVCCSTAPQWPCTKSADSEV